MWREMELPVPSPNVGVNLSARGLGEPDPVEYVAEVLRDSGLEARELVLEVTESAAVEEAGPVVETLGKLKELGVRIAIDDFGTGYSALSRLRDLPADYVKLDRTFMRDLDRDLGTWKLTLGAISFVHFLGLGVIAEGVETGGQLARLRTFKCDLAQGNYFVQPCPGEAVPGLLAGRLRA